MARWPSGSNAVGLGTHCEAGEADQRTLNMTIKMHMLAIFMGLSLAVLAKASGLVP
jgi:hypothetical protein